MAKNQFDVQVAVNFARINNVRLVIRNTGHDYLGRSQGAGALALNTHGLGQIQFIPKYSGAGNYTGSAVKLGAGVLFKDLYPQAKAQGVDVVGAESLVSIHPLLPYWQIFDVGNADKKLQTVGAAGGYIQGGGYSPLSGIHGLGGFGAV
jgi:hypothetical protein